MKSQFLSIFVSIIACSTFAHAQDTLPNKEIVTSHTTSGQNNNILPQNDQLALTVTDVDGNKYGTVKIGTQIWMTENLRVTKYNDATDIPLVKDSDIWARNFKNKPKPMMSWYDNNKVKYTANQYGALYNWYVINPAANGNKNVCPIDWHVPTDDEWTIMENFLIVNTYNYDSTSGGDRSTNNKIAKSLSATKGWSADGGVGAVGNTDYVIIRNKSGFNAAPAGYRGFGGTFINISKYGYWWSSTQTGAGSAWGRSICYSNSFVEGFNKNKAYGFSIRCIRD